MSERWLPVPGTEGRYEVSDQGRVRSNHPRRSTPRLLKGEWTEQGYHRTWITDRHRFTHRLVLEAFVGPGPFGHETRHLDGDPANNTLPNLAWGTKSENRRDRVLHGRDRRTHCPANHPYDEANTYTSPRGDRMCRKCHSARQTITTRRKRAARKAVSA